MAVSVAGPNAAVGIQNAAMLQHIQRSNPMAAAALATIPAVNPAVIVNNAPSNSVLLVGNLSHDVSYLPASLSL